MELVLGLLLAGAVAFAAWCWAAVQRLRAHERRLLDELEALRRSTSAPGYSSGVYEAAAERISGLPPESSLQAEISPFTSQASLVTTPLDLPGTLSSEMLVLRRLEPGATDILSQLGALELLFNERLDRLAGQGSQIMSCVQAVPSLPELSAAGIAGPLERTVTAAELVRDEVSNATSLAEGVSSAASRAVDSARSLVASAVETDRLAQALIPFSATLSGLADRMNLLALNIALLASKAGEGGEPFERFGLELRGFFEESRRLSRELATASQKAVNAAARSSESAREISQEAGHTFSRARSNRDQLGRIGSVIDQLDAALDTVRESGVRLSSDVQKAVLTNERAMAHLKTQNELVSQAAQQIEEAVERFRPLSDSFFRVRTAAESHLMRLHSESNIP